MVFQDHANCYHFLLFLCSSPSLAILHSWITYFFPVDLDPLSVECAGHYSRARPISHLPKPSVSCDNQGHTVQGSFIINAARTLVGRIKCGSDNFSLNCSYTILPCVSYCTRLFFGERSGRLPLMACRSFLLESRMSRTESSSATSLGHLDFHHMFLGISILGIGLGPSTKWVGIAKFSDPTISYHHIVLYTI